VLLGDCFLDFGFNLDHGEHFWHSEALSLNFLEWSGYLRCTLGLVIPSSVSLGYPPFNLQLVSLCDICVECLGHIEILYWIVGISTIIQGLYYPGSFGNLKLQLFLHCLSLQMDYRELQEIQRTLRSHGDTIQGNKAQFSLQQVEIKSKINM
jgi:hypothetical protein